MKNRLTPEALVNAIGLLILCGLFLFWDISRALYVLMALWAMVYLIRFRPVLPRDQLLFSLPIFGFILAHFISLWYHGFPDRGMNMLTSGYFLLLLAVPLVSLFYCQFNPGRNVWMKFLLANILLGAIALIDIFVLDKARANAGNNAVVFGFISVVISSVVIASYRLQRQQKYGAWWYVSALVLGLIAILLSGSRGSWIAALAVAFIATIIFLDRYPLAKRVPIAVIMICCIALLSLSLPQVQKRINHMVEIVAPYITGEQQGPLNSFSYRIEAWKAAAQMGSENPLLGIGPGHFRQALKAYVQQNPELDRLQIMKHAHNQYMQTFATGGVVGLVALLVLLGSHLWLFARYLVGTYPLEVRSFAIAGFLLVIAYALLCITAVPFERKKLILLYGFSSAMLWSCLLGALKLTQSSESLCHDESEPGQT